jgi:hypothetical protein
MRPPPTRREHICLGIIETWWPAIEAVTLHRYSEVRSQGYTTWPVSATRRSREPIPSCSR